MRILLPLLFLLVAAGGTGVVLTREPRRQVLAIAANGFVLTALFLALQAPDVAYAEIAVGSAFTPLLFLAALTSMRLKQRTEDREEDT